MDRMPGTKVSMRKVCEVLRLKHALGMSERLIAEAVGIGKTAVGEYLRRARVLGLAWPLADGEDDAELDDGCLRRLVSMMVRPSRCPTALKCTRSSSAAA